MTKNYEKSGDSPKTPPDKIMKELAHIADFERPDFDDFRNKRDKRLQRIFRNNDITRHEAMLEKKLRNETGEADFVAEGLEAMIYYVIQNRELFSQDAYAFPGSLFDDRFNGADIVCGFPKLIDNPNQTNKKYDLVFSLDITTDTLGKSSVMKFKNSDYFSRTEAPYTGRVDYFKHDSKKIKLSDIPHYVVGIDPTCAIYSAQHFIIKPNLPIEREPDPAFDEKILVELYLQSSLGIKACNNVPKDKQNEYNQKAKSAHLLINQQTARELYYRFNLSYPDEKEQFDSAIEERCSSFCKNDRTFNLIYAEWNERNHKEEEKLQKRFAKRANRIAIASETQGRGVRVFRNNHNRSSLPPVFNTT